jgi:hypothetical protein
MRVRGLIQGLLASVQLRLLDGHYLLLIDVAAALLRIVSVN